MNEMNGDLTIHKSTEKAFKRACNELGIEYQCIKEGIDGDLFIVTFDAISDIYALGQMVGGEAVMEFQIKGR